MSKYLDKELMQIAQDAITCHGAVQHRTELAALLVLLRDHNISNILEIGSEAGGTLWAFSQVSNPSGLKISLDLPTGDSGSGIYANPESLAQRTNLFKSFASNVVCIAGDSHAFTSLRAVKYVLKDELLDFLFIDGDHSEAGVRKDWEMYSQLVRPGGIVAFHDIKDCEFHRHRNCYVADFWKSLDGRKAEILSGEGHWGGIGVVFV